VWRGLAQFEADGVRAEGLTPEILEGLTPEILEGLTPEILEGLMPARGPA